ncbi:MAG: DMT family transporter [Alphaproteobacteria bacterium]|nr:DMT family transporter [Alphaproteobacteria bacterium]
MARDPRLRLWGYLLLISAGWGSGFLMIKVAASSMPPFAIATGRGAVSAAAVLLFVLATRHRLRPNLLQLRHMAVLGTFSGWLPNVLSAIAMVEIGSALAAMIQASTPLMVALLAHVFLADERLTARRGTGVLVGLGGIFLLVGPAAVMGAGGTARGGVLMVLVSLSYAIGTVYMRRARNAEPVATVLGQQVFSMLPALALALAFEPPSAWQQPTTVWLAILGLGVVASAVPMVLFLRMLAFAAATQASSVGYLMPLWAAALGILVLGEHIGLVAAAGAVVVLTGVWLVTSAPARQAGSS